MADSGQDIAAIKKLLMLSKKEPVNCAIGIAPDNTAVIMLDKIKRGPAIIKELEKAVGKIKSPAFGTASVDTEFDAKLVVLQLNKAVTRGLGQAEEVAQR